MKKDTKRIEAILAGLKQVRNLVRDERIDGGTWEHVDHDLEKHEIAFTQRLLELREHNARLEKPEPTPAQRDGHQPNPVPPVAIQSETK